MKIPEGEKAGLGQGWGEGAGQLPDRRLVPPPLEPYCVTTGHLLLTD